jgi:hypothetical protein
MRRVRTILVVSMMVASFYMAAGTAWARSDALQRGTAWTDAEDPTLVNLPDGISWELSPIAF